MGAVTTPRCFDQSDLRVPAVLAGVVDVVGTGGFQPITDDLADFRFQLTTNGSPILLVVGAAVQRAVVVLAVVGVVGGHCRLR